MFSLILVGLSIFVLIVSGFAIWSKAIVDSYILLLINVVIEHITSKKLTTIDIQKNNYCNNKSRVKAINELLKFLSNKEEYSNISYNPKTKTITYFNEDGLLRNLDAIHKINNNGKVYTEYWINDYIKVDIDKKWN